MSLTVEHHRFYCTTADVPFGPIFSSDDEGEQFRTWMYRNHGDARQFFYEQLATWLAEFRAEVK